MLYICNIYYFAYNILVMSDLLNIPDDVPQAGNKIVLETYDDLKGTASKALLFSKENCKDKNII